jgi:DNA processing protein
VLSRFSLASELIWWLTLWRTPGVGSTAFQILFEHYQDSPQTIFSESKERLVQLGIHPKSIAAITQLNNQTHPAAESDLAWLAQDNHHLLHIESDLYPPLLKETVNAPALLFVQGEPSALLTPQMAIVGSRHASTLGKDTAFEFAKQLSSTGLTITSGLALGIDTHSHEGALANQGKTVAVLGTGVDVLYPAQNKKLAARIMEEGGALVSEAPLGTQALPDLFPRRNRIISGLSLGVLVVEAAVRSGSLITARLASEQGREVFAIPGSIHNAMHKGCHKLIRDGATLVETADDIVESLSSLAQFQLEALQRAKEKIIINDSEKIKLDNKTKAILKNIGFEPTPIDVIVERCNLSAAETSGLLLSLELEGLVAAEAGGYMKTTKDKHIV